VKSKLYVANISFQASEDDLKDLFAQHGDVSSVKIVMNRDTGRSKGFGFVEMESAEGATAAREALNGKEAMGRTLRVDEAHDRPKTDRPDRSDRPRTERPMRR